MSEGRRQQTDAELAATVQGGLQKAETLDAREDAEYGRGHRGDELPTGVANKQARLDKMRHAKVALEAAARASAAATRPPSTSPAAPPTRGRPRLRPADVSDSRPPRNVTDPESRSMKTAEGVVQGDHAQAAVEAASQMIVAQQVTPAPNDQQQRAPLVAQIKAHTGRQARAGSADAGSGAEANLRELRRRPSAPVAHQAGLAHGPGRARSDEAALGVGTGCAHRRWSRSSGQSNRHAGFDRGGCAGSLTWLRRGAWGVWSTPSGSGRRPSPERVGTD